MLRRELWDKRRGVVGGFASFIIWCGRIIFVHALHHITYFPYFCACARPGEIQLVHLKRMLSGWGFFYLMQCLFTSPVISSCLCYAISFDVWGGFNSVNVNSLFISRLHCRLDTVFL